MLELILCPNEKHSLKTNCMDSHFEYANPVHCGPTLYPMHQLEPFKTYKVRRAKLTKIKCQERLNMYLRLRL